MDFVFVGDTQNKQLRTDDFRLQTVKLTSKTLLSLIDGIKQDSFGYDTVGKFVSDLAQYKSFIDKEADAKVFLDSGGYSIIKGDVAIGDINKVIDCYTQVLKTSPHAFDYVFSLDIPFSQNYAEFNTVSAVENANRRSLAETVAVLNSNPSLWKKFYFVWHFKMPSQYRIWSQLYSELELQKHTSNYAIGGLVSLRKSAKTPRSPFTVMAFRCLLDFAESNIENIPLRIHFLGINLQQDRLQIAILEKLFNRIQNTFAVHCTYDSVSYAHNARNAPHRTQWVEYANDQLTHGDLDSAPTSLIQQAYSTDSLQSTFLKTVESIKNGNRMSDGNTLLPLSIASELHLDTYFEHVAEEMVEILLTASTHNQLQKAATACIADMCSSSTIFSEKFAEEALDNVTLIYQLLCWWKQGKSRNKLEGFIQDQINEIQFPCDLH